MPVMNPSISGSSRERSAGSGMLWVWLPITQP